MIFIKGRVPSSKNGKRWVGKYLINSKVTLKYIKETEAEYISMKEQFIEESRNKEMPLMIGFHFVRGTRHKYDFINALQICQDLMVKYGWLEDDNTSVMYPVPLLINGQYSSYNKNSPGVYINII